MASLKLWEVLKDLQKNYRWVDLTHELSPETPHWYGFKPFEAEILFDYTDDTDEDKKAPMRCFQYTVASQYGTHVDAPVHFHQNARALEAIDCKELVFPLVVIDKSEEAAENPEFTLEIAHIKQWEDVYGKIPEGAFVAFRTDWCHKKDLENKDDRGVPHYPGWSVDAIKWLVEKRNIGAIGHEPADTDPSYITMREDMYPYPAEQYILGVDRFQIEVMKNLDKLPPVGGIIFTTFPKIKGGVGSPARCFAIVPE